MLRRRIETSLAGWKKMDGRKALLSCAMNAAAWWWL